MAKQRAAAAAPPLRFRGLPQRLSLSSAALAGHDYGGVVLPDALARYSRCATDTLRVRHRCSEKPSLRLRLDSTTPPGRYPAQLRLSGKSVPAEIEIAAAPDLAAVPAGAKFVARPGSDATAEFTLINKGNVAIEFPERFEAALFDDALLETAFAELSRQESDDPVQLVGSVLRSLRSLYGGILTLRVAEGAGPLPPSAERILRLSARLPKGLKPGHFYHGMWKLHKLRFRIKVAALDKGGK